VAYNPLTYNPEARRKSYLKHKEKYKVPMREYSLKRKFNLSPEEYNDLLEKQGGVCAICKQNCTRALAVDHNHTTGKVRGLLCNNCNRGIGHLRDSIDLLKSATSYLEYYDK
jgi:hypothetical protein